MKPEMRKIFMEIAHNQDSLMHSSSGDLGVKTSLYLVFTAFLFSAGIQTINTAVGHLGSAKLLIVSLWCREVNYIIPFRFPCENEPTVVVC